MHKNPNRFATNKRDSQVASRCKTSIYFSFEDEVTRTSTRPSSIGFVCVWLLTWVKPSI